MPRRKFPWPADLPGRRIASAARSWRPLALSLSVAAHLSLILFIDTQVVLVRNIAPSEPAANSPISIHLVRPEVSGSALDIKPIISPEREKAIDETRQSALRPTQPPLADPQPFFEILVPPTPYYFPTTVLTEKPKVSSDIPFDLVVSAGKGIEPTAIVRLKINEKGEIDQIVVDESTFSESEQRKIIDAFQKMKFAPGKIEGSPVKTEMKIEITVEKTLPAP